MNRKFSINSIALGNIRRRRGNYLLLIFGIVLAIYFVAAALFFADTMFTSLREQHYKRLGTQDAIILNCGGAPLEDLVTGGIFSEFGQTEIMGYALPEDENPENGFSLARFDETALNLFRLKPLEGRLPEKSGEIALEQGALARLRLRAKVGDRITLTLLIPDGNAFMAEPVKKNYVLVGILPNRLIHHQNRYALSVPAYDDYPAGLLSDEEQIEPGGRAVLNCYGRYAGNGDGAFEELSEFCNKHNIVNELGWPGVLETRYRLFAGSYGSAGDDSIVLTSIFFAIIALVLVGAACLGIINAFTADLDSRKRQIGLLRAVGATQRQIRAIYGREAILLASCSIPPALALAALTVGGITAMLGDSYTFRLNVPVLLAVAAAGVLCVRLAVAIPLRKAGRIPPMQAIRDVEIIRRLKRSRVQSRRFFNVPRHLARRRVTLYRSRQAGITAMLTLSIVLLSLAAFGIGPLLGESNYDYDYDYILRNTSGRYVDWLIDYDLHQPGITEQDRADAAALVGVKEVRGEKSILAKILVEEATPYIINSNFGNFDYLSPEPPQGDDSPDSRVRAAAEHSNYLASKAHYGYSQDYLAVSLGGMDGDFLKKLQPFVSAGEINIDRLNSGQEILIIAPAQYGLIQNIESDEFMYSVQRTVDYELDPGKTYDAVYRNDLFRAGDSITLSFLYSDNPGDHPDGPRITDNESNRIFPDDAVRVDRQVTIGAILEPERGVKRLNEHIQANFFYQIGDTLTTSAGLQALGFDPPYRSLAITLSEDPDEAMEGYLEDNLGWIAARTSHVEVRSYVALSRENRRNTYGLVIAAGAILLLLFAICASMINNALSARIRAGKREIGTLRAVGASEEVITRSYRWQLLSTFAWGTAAGLAIELALCGWIMSNDAFVSDGAILPLWPPLLFVALLLGIGLLNI
ncbi:MAG: FtsX-like permease family protein, partial [Firmicutes bacterium]|nr:FtsX-like permease family protein [Bacillota bacterium]